MVLLILLILVILLCFGGGWYGGGELRTVGNSLGALFVVLLIVGLLEGWF